jgi:uncharacterized protein (TIGR03084 family)
VRYGAAVERALVHELAAEQATLDALVSTLDEDGWATPTPAEGWNVRDQIAHLAFFDDVARASLAAGEDRSFRDLLRDQRRQHPDALSATPGAGLGGAGVLSWWRAAREAEIDGFRRVDGAARVPWGPNRMAATSLCTARLMETWAHGLDCFAALGAEPVDTDRLRHVCHITYRAIPHAFRDAGLAMPAQLDQLAVDVVAPDGGLWRFGPPDAPERITGQAAELARVGVRRLALDDAPSVRADGPFAEAAVRVLKAYL